MFDTLSLHELQPYEYKGFTIARDKATMLLSIVAPANDIPSRLQGRYTKEPLVEDAIDRYLEDIKRLAKTNDKNTPQD